MFNNKRITPRMCHIHSDYITSKVHNLNGQFDSNVQQHHTVFCYSRSFKFATTESRRGYMSDVEPNTTYIIFTEYMFLKLTLF